MLSFVIKRPVFKQGYQNCPQNAGSDDADIKIKAAVTPGYRYAASNRCFGFCRSIPSKNTAQMQGRCDLGEELITFLGSEIAQGATDETNHPAGQLVGILFQRQFIGSYQSVNL